MSESVIVLYILIDLEIHVVFANPNKIYCFSLNLSLCIFNKEIYENSFKSIMKSNQLLNLYH